MMLIYIVIIAGILSAIGQFIDKYLTNIGISKNDYFYYMCLTMIPFSLIMIAVECVTGQFKFELSIVSILLLILALIFRYYKQHTIVGCLKYLNPHEDSAYLTLGIVIAFIIDVLLGSEDLKIVSIVSIIMTLAGVFIISNSKLKIKNLQKYLLVRISATLAMSYVTYFMLMYWSNAVFLLIVNLLLTIIFAHKYSFKYHLEKKRMLKWCFIQQIFGFGYLYLSNYLVGNSVTLSSYVKPTSILVVLIGSMFLKDASRKPTLKQVIGILFIITSLMLINCS